MSLKSAKGNYEQGSRQTQGNQKEKEDSMSTKFDSFISEEEVTKRLQALVDSPSTITRTSYSPNTALYPDNRMSFVQRHIAYLRSHKNVDPEQYLSNIKLMITKR